mmetsp:Transcript_4164/g.15709  ORF Transcript_4164/g.15709 Transcript_4164/m.15709 type:complete len:246 (-) Transcript_4164:465-1202(-)
MGSILEYLVVSPPGLVHLYARSDLPQSPKQTLQWLHEARVHSKIASFGQLGIHLWEPLFHIVFVCGNNHAINCLILKLFYQWRIVIKWQMFVLHRCIEIPHWHVEYRIPLEILWKDVLHIRILLVQLILIGNVLVRLVRVQMLNAIHVGMYASTVGEQSIQANIVSESIKKCGWHKPMAGTQYHNVRSGFDCSIVNQLCQCIPSEIGNLAGLFHEARSSNEIHGWSLHKGVQIVLLLLFSHVLLL